MTSLVTHFILAFLASVTYGTSQTPISVHLRADTRGAISHPMGSIPRLKPAASLEEIQKVFQNFLFVKKGQYLLQQGMKCHDLTSVFLAEYIACGNGSYFGKAFQVIVKGYAEREHVLLAVEAKGIGNLKVKDYTEDVKNPGNLLCFLEPQGFLSKDIERFIGCYRTANMNPKDLESSIPSALREQLFIHAQIKDPSGFKFLEGMNWKGDEQIMEPNLLWFLEPNERRSLKIKESEKNTFFMNTGISIKRSTIQPNFFEFQIPSETKSCGMKITCEYRVISKNGYREDFFVDIFERRNIRYPLQNDMCRDLQVRASNRPTFAVVPPEAECQLVEYSCR